MHRLHQTRLLQFARMYPLLADLGEAQVPCPVIFVTSSFSPFLILQPALLYCRTLMGKRSNQSESDRYRTSARDQVRRRAEDIGATPSGDILAHSVHQGGETTKTGGLNEKSDGRGLPGSTIQSPQYGGKGGNGGLIGGGGPPSYDHTDDKIYQADTSGALPAHKSEAEGPGVSALEATLEGTVKPTLIERMRAGMSRFVINFKNAIFHSWVNVLLIFVPIGIAAEAAGLSPAIVFAMNAVAIIPLAGLLAFATEAVAARLGDTLGALLNVSFGNAVELIIFIIALVKNEIEIVQASLLGSILANLLLILGMAFLLGGLRYREQIYNNTVTQMSACLLSLSVISLLLPVSYP